jgi:hypothetical protein
MAFKRQYSESEVRGMLMILEGNKNLAKHTPVPPAKIQPAHAVARHGGAGADEMADRVLTPKQPKLTSSYKDLDTQVRATMELLNCATGQSELEKLDNGSAKRVVISADFNGTHYLGAQTNKKPDGTVVHGIWKRATKGTVVAERFVGNLLLIQTSFPTVT